MTSNVINLRPSASTRRVLSGSRPVLFDWATDEGNTVPICLTPIEWSLLAGTLHSSQYPAVQELGDTIESQIRQHLGTYKHPSAHDLNNQRNQP